MSGRRFVRALVTGGSSGIGQALAEELACRGTDLVLVARNEERLRALATDLGEAYGVEVRVMVADLVDPEGLGKIEERLRDRTEPVDLLVNNAGVGQVGRFEDLDVDDAQRQVALNVLAPLRLAHAALPVLHEGHGAILNVSSIGGNQPVPHMATYAGTKAFLTSWSEALHEELRPTPVRVTALTPGFTASHFADEAGAGRASSRIPSRVWADPNAVARAGIDGVTAGRAVVTPGPVYRVTAAVGSTTPSVVTRRVIGVAMRLLRR